MMLLKLQCSTYYVQEVSLGKDTMTGHWEIMGLNITEPFDTFWNGFPEEIHLIEEKEF